MISDVLVIRIIVPNRRFVGIGGENDEPLGIVDRQGAQQDRVDQREYCCVGSDTER